MSNTDFSNPTRQSGVAILLILFKTVNMVFRQLMPAVIVIVLGGSERKSDQFLYLAIGIAGISLILSTINYFRTYFLVSGNDLILHSGAFKHKKTTIPFTRIQSVNFEQNVVHQIFNVLKVKIDTAGSDKSEFEFHALDQGTATSLRDLVLAFKVSAPDEIPLSEEKTEMSRPPQTILNLSDMEVLKVGLTMNHLRSGGLIFLFFFWIYEKISEFQPEKNLPDAWEMSFVQNTSILLIAVILILLAAVIISVARAFATYYDLKVDRIEGGFKVYSGLITRKEVSARDPKIQFVSWSDNPLRRMIGMFQLTLHQVISNETKSGGKIQIPGCSFSKIQDVLKYVFADTDLDQIETSRVHQAYFYRFGIIITVAGAMITAVLFFSGYFTAGYVLVFLMIYLIISRLLSFKKIRFGIHDHTIFLKKGTFGNIYTLINVTKVQSVAITQSPYQRRHNLCSFLLVTAAGNLTIPYVAKETATEMMDYIMYKVESSRQSWM